MAKKNAECQHNFASSSSGAAILASPKGATGVGNILKNGKDDYVIIPCSEKKEFIISLSEDAIISKFLLLSHEEFSSKIDEFDLFGADTYDSENPKWEQLGTFKTNPDFNGIWQSFLVKETWIRYLKFEWKTSLGPYTYCTLTQLKVCGRTMVQGLTEELKNMDILEEENVEDTKEEHTPNTPARISPFEDFKPGFQDRETQSMIEDMFTFSKPKKEKSEPDRGI